MTIPISSTPIVFFLSLLTGISFSHLKLAIRTLALISLFYFVNPLFSHVIFFLSKTLRIILWLILIYFPVNLVKS